MNDISLENFAEMDSSDQDDIINAMYLNVLRLYKKRQNLKRRRRWRVRPINMDWAKNGYHQKTFRKIKEMDEEQLFCHTRMSKEIFEKLLKLTTPSLTKYKEQIHAEERLSLTLLYLAHGVSIENLASSHKVGKTTARNIILETCDVLWEILSPIYLSEPTEHQYKTISNDFWQMWNIPNCVGVVDGKHIAIKSSSKLRSQFVNRKKFSNVVLIAACDAKYTFTAVSLGTYNSRNDGEIFRVNKFVQNLAQNRLKLPPSTPLPFTLQPFPYYFVGDCRIPLKKNFMKPYTADHTNETRNVFNYRLSRVLRVIENSFGILTARWRVMKTTMEFSPENAEKIILACLVLHNFVVRNDTNRWYCPQNYVDTEEETNLLARGEWRNELEAFGGPLLSATSAIMRGADSAYNEREHLTNYFLNEGAVSFQSHIL